jgi:hypothetical protein
MNHKIIALCALLAAAAIAQAQTFGSSAPPQSSGAFTIKCNPTTVSQTIQPGWTISTFTCQTTATINGVPIQVLTYSSTGQVSAAANNVWGVIVGTLANGDQAYFEYHTSGRPGSALTMTYKMTGGTGIANGMTGSGRCNVPAGAGSELTCNGN